MKNLFWIHGGPGFNNKVEKLTFEKSLIEANFNPYFWNHPSTRRGDTTDNSWNSYIEHLKKDFQSFTDEFGPTILICHSFGARCSLELLNSFSHNIESVVWISGALDMLRVCENVFSFTMEDFKKNQVTEKAELLQELFDQKVKTLPPFLDKFYLVSENESLVQHYWKNLEAAMNYYPQLVEEWEIDGVSIDTVLRTMPLKFDSKVFNIPLLQIIGKYEEIIDCELEASYASNLFTNSTAITFEKSSHFSHLEEPQLFLKTLNQFLNLSTIVKDEETLNLNSQQT